MPSLPLDPKTEQRVQNELAAGETVRWSSSAQAGRFVIRSLPSAGIIVVGAGFMASFFDPGLAVSSGPHGLLILALVLAAGGCLTISEAIRAGRIGYVVTDRRAFVLDRTFFGSAKVQSFLPSSLGTAAKVLRPDGSGDIYLGTILVRGRRGPSARTIGFFGLSEPGAAFESIERLAKGVPQSPLFVPPREFSVAQIALPLIFFVGGCFMLVFGGRQLLEARRSVSWPTASGTILSSRIAVYHGRHTSYRAQVKYDYQVGATDYSGSLIAFGGERGMRRDVRATVLRYQMGNVVSVYYDPANPKICVLEPGIKPAAWLLPGYGILIVLTGICFLSAQLMSNWPSRPKQI